MTILNTRPDGIFFDWDGTLADSFQFLEDAHNHALEVFQMPVRNPGWFRFYFGKDREFIYQDIYGKKADEAKGHFETYVRKNHTTGVQKLNNADTVLNTIKQVKIPCGIVTNKVGDFVRKEIIHFGWDHHFTVIIGAGEAEQDKPSDAPLRLATQKLSLKGKNVWYVGDSETDLKCARKYGCPFILIHPYSDELPPFYNENDCAATFPTLEKFNEFLLQSL